ncbi:hypothetical protein APHNP_1199 [Anaplasma phagocytophilum str. ApNP]|uniref:Uncharacterized protein n=2 Tax=Anaplasma phagocytophilum TaxID=948 RepID=A0A0F3NJW7_ANAPH|nr:hypothetical protein APHMUC_1381 [Anaplasma phagocytophilum str. ApMUC09]KJV67189.1 hypothetical protein APHNP_1199 [Anaplasma phagocytophilum str. ApNP]
MLDEVHENSTARPSGLSRNTALQNLAQVGLLFVFKVLF